jgi:hypothetical protein
MRVFIFSLIVVLAGCGEKAVEKPRESAPPKPPKIKHFYGNATVVPKGQSLTICYGTEDVDSLKMEPYDDDLRPSFNRCVAHTPVKDTTYTLTAKGPGGVTTATFSVRVGPAAVKPREMIQNFQSLGGGKPAGAPVQLCYSTEGATAVSVRPAVPDQLGVGKNQCFVVKPLRTTTYVMTATAADGAVDRMQVTVPVQ